MKGPNMLVSNARHVFLFCLRIAILGWNTPIKYSYGAKLIHMGEEELRDWR